MKFENLPKTAEDAARCTSIGGDADLRGYAHELPRMMAGVPAVNDLDRKILDRIEANPKCFDMADWHCGTTHCRAGHAIDLAGEAGYALEKKFSSSVAGALIYMASCPGQPVPDFRCTNEEALEDMRSRVGS